MGETTVDISKSKIFIVDDDTAMRDSLATLFLSVGYPAETYASGPQFLANHRRDRPACLILDVRMPQMTGLAVQEHLKGRGASLPIIVLTGHAEVGMAVRAMKAGAFDFLLKPFSEHELLECTRGALARAWAEFEDDRERNRFERRLRRLTPREREVLLHVLEGKANKVIASDLQISQKTVEVHRYHVMHKMGARSAVELAKQAGKFSGAFGGC
jgi:FixJ family two-component response regulator